MTILFQCKIPLTSSEVEVQREGFMIHVKVMKLRKLTNQESAILTEEVCHACYSEIKYSEDKKRWVCSNPKCDREFD
jgi:NAD-dependent DNA ligase